MNWHVLLTLAGAAWLLSSCAIAPASVKRISKQDKRELHALLEQALKEDDSEATLALGRFVERWKDEGLGQATVLKADGLTYQVRIEQEPGEPSLTYYDKVQPVADFKVGRLKRHARPGIGAPMMALRENRHSEKIENYYPPELIVRAITAVAHAEPARGGVQQVRIRLVCPLRSEEVVIHGKRLPLAADFSTPWAAGLARTGKLNQSRILDMLTPKPQRQPQLYLMEPYDPNKEPLIMIHGLLSTPLAWAELSNDLWADETIRKRYQIWHYLYNTSAPALYSTRILRVQLKELRALLDPEGDDPAMRKTTLLTHSMGGLVGKALALEPGDAFWKAAFIVPPDQLKLSPENRVMLHEAFEWKPDRTVHRIIFVCTPHRGSAFADNIVGRLGSLLAVPPSTFQTFFEELSKDNPNVFTPSYMQLRQGRLDSVVALSPRQPTLRILAELPYARPVTTHSIIGNRGLSGPLEKSSDGIVPYISSHLENADSEVIVPAGHGAFKHPLAVAEIKRVLKLK